jgi:hypothetical protein
LGRHPDGVWPGCSRLQDRSPFGTKNEVDPVRHLIGAASAWSGNPERDALYLNVVPAKNDGTTAYKLDVNSVLVDGFWSIRVYNAEVTSRTGLATYRSRRDWAPSL